MNIYAKITKGCNEKNIGDVKILTSPLMDNTGLVTHGFFLRTGGVSKKPYDSLNFSRKREGSEENFISNLEIASHALDIEMSTLTIINYEHGNNVCAVSKEDCGKGIFLKPTLSKCDGLCTNSQDVSLMTLHADCVPIFFLDPETKSVALCHAGWRGVFSHIAANAIASLINYGAKPKNIICVIAPFINVCCFEVSEELAQNFCHEFGSKVAEVRNGKYFIDLSYAIVLELASAGIEPENINLFGECTSCYPDKYFSHRRDRGQTGSMAAIIKIK